VPCLYDADAMSPQSMHDIVQMLPVSLNYPIDVNGTKSEDSQQHLLARLYYTARDTALLLLQPILYSDNLDITNTVFNYY